MIPDRRPRHRLPALLLLIGGLAPPWADAAPYRPTSDAEVLERLPARLTDPAARELAALRAAWQADPKNVERALALAEHAFAQAQALGDPRYVGQAQAALAPWWKQADPPADVRVMRAIIQQYGHRFDAALADLDAVVAAQPDHAQAWSWLTAIHLVRADVAQADRACEALAHLVNPLIAAGCRAQVDAMRGRSAGAAAALRRALDSDPAATPEQRLWALTRLAEIEWHRGDNKAAETAFRSALALDLSDVYLLAAYADFLLDQGRPAEVLPLLKGRESADVLLVRLALAARAASDPGAGRWAAELTARFDAARARGDTTHRKEEARFVLVVQGRPEEALALARANYAEQRELADARMLLEAAIAARQPAAAVPVMDWMAASGNDSVILRALAERLKALS